MKKIWHILSTQGESVCTDPYELKTLRLVNRLSVVLVILMLEFIILGAVMQMRDFYWLAPGFAIMFTGPLVFNRLGYFRVARIYFALAPLVCLVVVTRMMGEAEGDKYFMLTTALIPLMLFRKRWFSFLVFSLNIALFFFILYYQRHHEQRVTVPDEYVIWYYSFNMMAIFWLLYLIVLYFKGDHEKYEQELEHRNDLISEKNKEIVDSITYAKRIQDAYLPPPNILQHYFPDSFLLFKPKDIVSGDFYWFYCEKFADGSHSDEVFIAVADCTGHGVPGAIMSVICCDALNEVVINNRVTQTGSILDEVRNIVIRKLKSERDHQQKDGMDISLCRINRRTGELQFSGANNPLWIVSGQTPGAENGFREIKADKQPVGLYENMKPFSNHDIRLETGDRVFIFSDGYADQFGGPKGKKFKYSNLQQLLRENANAESQTINHKLQTVLNTWKGDLEQVDDICIIGFRM